MTLKNILLTVLATGGAVLLWKNYAPLPTRDLVNPSSGGQPARIESARPRAVTTTAPQPVPASRGPGSVVIAPAPNGNLAGRFKTGPNAQNNWAPDSGRLKTGPNAQTDLDPKRSNLKTGPNAQTDLTMKRSW